MAWMTTTATDYKDCLDKVRQFCIKTKAAGAVTHGGGNTGDGNVYGASATASSVAEVWTLTCTTAGGNGTAVFSVSGSVSGSKANATAGVPYSIAEVSLIVTGGGIDFAVSDSFTFSVTNSTAEWAVDRWDTSSDYELIMHGIGGGTDEVYVGYKTTTNNSTYWNWLVTGLTGYVAANDIDDQPGYYPYYDCMNNTNFTFTCIFTSRHIKVIPTAVSGEQGGSYIGWFLPHATPSQWSYPMFCGGSTDDFNQVIGGTEDDHTCYWNAYDNEYSGAVLDSTFWIQINRYSPRHYAGFDGFRPGLDDDMRLYPAVPLYENGDKVYGELEGVYYPSPYISGTGLLSAGDVIITSDIAALCFKDVFRSSAGSIVAMDLMGDI